MTGTRKTQARWLASVALVVSGAAALVARPVETRADPLLDLPFSAVTGCTYYCRSCGDGKHEIIQGVSRNAGSSHLETCNEGTCSMHGCDVDLTRAEELERIWFAVRDADGPRLREILAENRATAYYNPGREAVQIRGCGGGVLASIPLSGAQVAAMEE